MIKHKIQTALAKWAAYFPVTAIPDHRQPDKTARTKIQFSACHRVNIATLLCMCMLSPQAFADNSGGAAQGIQLDDAVSVARKELWQLVGAGNSSSASVAVMANGKIVYSEGFGMADREKSIPVDSRTRFNIGSISKVYVAAAVMLLAEDGKLSLDKSVIDYIPEFKMADPRYKDITVRMLLNHTCGLPGTEHALSSGFKYNAALNRETLATLSVAKLKHKPGTMAVYCNDGFTLAEIVVERVSGMSYLDFLKERIFKPLGLKRTDASLGALKNSGEAAKFYDPESGLPRPLEAMSPLGAGGLSSTPEEICAFVDAVVGGRAFFPAEVVKQMKAPQPGAAPLKLRNSGSTFGLGWDMTSIPKYEPQGIHVLGKSGGSGEYHSMVYVVPEKRVAVTVLAAGTTGKVSDIALDILDTLMFGRKQETKWMTVPEGGKIPDKEASFAGYYADGERLFKAEFDLKSNKLIIKNCDAGGDMSERTYSYLDGLYFNNKGERWYFVSDGGNSYLVANLYRYGIDYVMFQKVEPQKKPLSLKINMDGRQWLWRNTSPFEAPALAEMYLTKSFLCKELPGYVYFLGVKRIAGPDCAEMPFDAIRDQSDLKLIDKNGAAWAKNSDLLFSPIDALMPLRSGERSVTIGPDGFNEWLLAKENLVLDATLPENGRLHVFSPDQEPLYDSALKPGERIIISKGCMVVLSGLPGAAFKIHAKTAPPLF